MVKCSPGSTSGNILSLNGQVCPQTVQTVQMVQFIFALHHQEGMVDTSPIVPGQKCEPGSRRCNSLINFFPITFVTRAKAVVGKYRPGSER